MADAPRRGDLDGRGNLSLQALEAFTLWFLDLGTLYKRYQRLVDRSEVFKPEAAYLL